MPESQFKDEIPLRFGKDSKLEADADEWLARGVGENKRSKYRDIEKMSYEFGIISAEECEFYDPTNDWDTQDEVYVRAFGNIDDAVPSLCSGDDGNVRARSRMDPHLPPGVWGRAGEEERRGLSRHVDDDDDWGSGFEMVPILGGQPDLDGRRQDEALRKTCTKCKRSLGRECFYKNPRAKDGFHAWCKPCLKSNNNNTEKSL